MSVYEQVWATAALVCIVLPIVIRRCMRRAIGG